MPRLRPHYTLAALLTLGCGGERARPKPRPDTARAAANEQAVRRDSHAEQSPDLLKETAPSSESPPPPSEVVFQVPMDVVLIISNSKRYGGTYKSSGIGRVCGRNPYQLPGMENSWVVEFSNNGELAIRDLKVTAKHLASGASTREYDLSVGVVNSGGVSPDFVLRTGDGGRSGQTGTMSLREEGYTARIKIEGRNARGEQVNVSITCKRGESRAGS
jgi:hypothetical protein